MRDPLTRSLQKLTAMFDQHSRRLRKLEVRSTPQFLGDDPEAPTVPTNLAGQAISYHQVRLTWSESTDNIAVAGYTIYRDSTNIGSTNSLIYNDFLVSGGTLYNYQIDAYDFAGNHSALTASVTVLTPGAPDTTPPSTPQNFAYSNLTATGVTLTWNASTDNVGVIGYTIYRNGMPISTPFSNTYTDNTVSPSTNYTYTVDAYDAAGNHSGQSAPLSVLTPGLPVVGTWYVSTTGLSTNGGTVSSPWSLDHALNGAGNAQILAGHTVYLREGTYSLTAAQVITALAGSAGNPISVRAYPGERVTMRNTYNGSSSYNNWELRTVSYTDFYDIEFDMTGYTRDSAGTTSGGMYLIFENTSYTQANINFYDCKLHDSYGSAVRSVTTSDEIEYNGCIFYYNGNDPDEDWTVHMQSATGNSKRIHNCVFIHNGGDDLRLYSAAGEEAIQDIDVDGNMFIGSGSLFTNPSRSILVGGTVATPTNITVDNNVSMYTRTPDSDARAYQVGDLALGGGVPVTVNRAVAAGADDGRWASDGSYNNNSSVTQLGRQSGVSWHSFFRFTSITIPNAATITACTIKIYPANAETATLNLKVYMDKSAVNPTAPSSYADADGRALTTASVDWDFTSWIAGGTGGTEGYTSPSIVAVAQEIVNQASWASGNAIVVMIKEDGGTSTNDMWPQALEGTSYPEAQLSITYTDTSSTTDGGANTVTATGNYFVGQPVDLDGSDYTGVTYSGNTHILVGSSHIGSTTTLFPTNTWNTAYPTTGSRIFCNTYDWDTRKANLMIINWTGASSVTVSAGDLTGLNLASGEGYELRNCENYYGDRIAGIYNGASINVPMTGRTMASTYGALADPTTTFPTLGVFQLVASGGEPPPPSGDTEAPTVPLNLLAVSAGSYQINLSWSASSDNIAVTGYTIYRDGIAIDTTTNIYYYSTGLTPNTAYSYTVDAYDAAGNHSAQSAASSATTSGLAPGSYYVSTTGLSTNDGSLASPWSITHALTGAGGVLVPGSTVYIRGGTYTLSSSVTISHDGTSASPIRYYAYPGEQPIIRNSYNGAQNLFSGSSYLYFYDIVFSGYNFTRPIPLGDGAAEMALVQTTATCSNIKFYACHFKNSLTHGMRAYEQLDGFECNGCLFTFNGQSSGFDHGVYTRGTDNHSKLFRDCVFCHNASHNIHCWGYSAGTYDQDEIDFVGCTVFQPASLYQDQDANESRNALFGGASGQQYDDGTVQYCDFYTNLGYDSNGMNVQIGYGGAISNMIFSENVIAGSNFYVYSSGATGCTVTNNTVYSELANEGIADAFLDGGTGNTRAATGFPTVGSIKRVRAFNWDNRRGKISIFNWALASSISITNAEFVAAGLVINVGDTYTLYNAENYFGDTITGTYNGTSISVPMTGRVVETPYGGITAPPTSFPRFGCFFVRVTPSAVSVSSFAGLLMAITRTSGTTPTVPAQSINVSDAATVADAVTMYKGLQVIDNVTVGETVIVSGLTANLSVNVTDGATVADTPTVSVPAAYIFNMDHEENNWSEYDGTYDTTSGLSIASPGLDSTSYTAAFNINDATTFWAYKYYTSTTGDVRIRAYVDPNSMTMTANGSCTLIVARNNTPENIGAIELVRNSANTSYRIGLYLISDAGVVTENYYDITDASHAVEFYIQRAATSSSADGSAECWIDGTSRITVTGIDNYDRFANLYAMRVGPVAISGTLSGTFYVDEILGNDTGTQIGT